MAARKISQREAKRLQKEVGTLKREHNELVSRMGWASPGTHIASLSCVGDTSGSLRTAQKLGFMLVAKHDGGNVHVYAVARKS